MDDFERINFKYHSFLELPGYVSSGCWLNKCLVFCNLTQCKNCRFSIENYFLSSI